MRNRFAALLAVVSVISAAVAFLRAGVVEHDVAQTYVRVLSVVWFAGALAQLALFAAMTTLRMGRLVFFMVSLLLTAAPCVGIVVMTVKLGGPHVVTAFCVAWLGALLTYLAEFGGLIRRGGGTTRR